MIAGLFYKCFRIIQCIDNVFMEIFFPDQLEETIFFHDLHRLFIDMREDQMDILFFGHVQRVRGGISLHWHR